MTFPEGCSDRLGSLKEVGEARIYLKGMPGLGGSIVVIYPDGFSELHVYDSDDEIFKAWLEMQMALEIRRPEENDLVILHVAGTGDFEVAGQPGLFTNLRAAYRHIRKTQGIPVSRRVWFFHNGEFYLLG